ncbi:MAG: glutamine synthetase III, partial [Clostridia bacterium]|nr:glutamine synthetase III [Clostridia bacterium]
MKKTKIEKLFGEYVCSDEVLKKYMPKKSYKNYINIKSKGEALDINTAKFIAKAIKDWSLKMGATHYSHWFMPLTNKTAEKQVSFIEIDANGKLIEDFSAKSLIKGETDASSFPNGGERVTFEARGYTVWDYTSPVFIKEDSAKNKVVYIPTAFCSYNGTALDDKTPLLRSIENLNTQALRVLKNLGYEDVKKVNFCIGAEQEYFLVRTEDFNKRIDLKMTGRTLLGAKPLMSQEQCSHYFGMIEDNISKFMNEIDTLLWKMGITAKLQHNEVAPSQHEFVPIFNLVNLSCDQNQLIMEVISRVAKKYGLTALFHEKPFEYINGSGKHANWSLSTDTGLNLFDTKLKDKTLFYTFFVAMICAIDRYYKLIRLSTAYRSNDLRLGGDEAPPALISVFASDYVLDLLSDIEKTTTTKSLKNMLDMGVKSLPKPEKDFCDRNRTSPFAFSGNKFEFRMVGSSQSVAWPSTCICTIFSKILGEIADELDTAITNKKERVIEYLKEKLNTHKRIVFNGNGYDDTWKKEAKE